MSLVRRFNSILGTLFLAQSISGCGVPFRYFPQAALGQLELFNRARPIEELIRDSRVPERVRALLSEIPIVKRFGESQGLKPTSNYVDYVALDRPAVVWVVSASPPLSFEPKRWTFPIVGGFTYVGWFSREAALKYAQDVRDSEGLDVDVRGASAYSTLGWFRDPVLSTMIPEGVEARADLVNVILHESVHASFYIDHQSAFNENLASFVADRLTVEYFKTRSEPDSMASLEAWKAREEKTLQRQRVMHEAFQKLDRLYQREEISEEIKLAQKNDFLLHLRKTLQIPESRPLNNATLIQYRTYFSGQKDWADFFEGDCSSDWRVFWERLEPLRKDSEKWFGRRQLEDFGPVLTALKQEKKS
jgi:predicted aminopeptidase